MDSILMASGPQTSACSAALESYLPLPLLFSLTNRNARDDAVTGGVRLIPRRAFSFVSRSSTQSSAFL